MKSLVIYNPYSGKGNYYKKAEIFIKEFKKKYSNIDVSYFITNDEIKENEYLNDNLFKFNILVVIGGDGTLNVAVNVIKKQNLDLSILYIPVGTVNDVGKMLKLSSDPVKALKLLENKPVLMDICKLNDDYFVYAAATGKYSRLSYGTKSFKTKRILGRFYYYFKALKDFFKKDVFDLEINGNKDKNYSLMMMLNTNHLGHFKIYLKNKLKLNDGKIELVFFKKTLFNNLNILNFFFLGILAKFKINSIVGSSFEISSSKNLKMNLDGEEGELNSNFKLDVIKEGIKIYVNSKVREKLF